MCSSDLEEKIQDSYAPAGRALVYMLRCIHGTPYTISVKQFDETQDSFDTEWNPISPHRLPFVVGRPPQLPQMLELAKELSTLFEFVRIDFHLGDDGLVYFSEFTFTPAGGTQIFSDELEATLGAKWV